MAFYVEEEDVWKCPKHPSKRRRSGICPTCLRDRLSALCPNCANVRPCSCCSTETASSSSSSSSSFSLFSSSGCDASKSGRVVGRVSNLIDSEPAFRRSRSVAVPFLRTRFSAGNGDAGTLRPTPPGTRSKSSFWSVFKTQSKSKKGDDEEREDEELKRSKVEARDDCATNVMRRSRSVSVPISSNSGAGDARSSSAKGRGWHFPSPINVFRHSKTSKVVQERSPLYRG